LPSEEIGPSESKTEVVTPKKVLPLKFYYNSPSMKQRFQRKGRKLKQASVSAKTMAAPHTAVGIRPANTQSAMSQQASTRSETSSAALKPASVVAESPERTKAMKTALQQKIEFAQREIESNRNVANA
jgi:hypothetical protein